MLVFIGSLIVIALFSALIAPFFIDWTNYRQDFEREASRLLGQPVTVDGSAEARLLPFPSVTFTDLSVGEAADGEPMLSIARFSMDAELAPFLSGEFRIFDMRIERPELYLRLSEDGTLDWAERDDTTAGPVSRAISEVVLEEVTVENGAMTLIDGASGRTYEVDDLDGTIAADGLTGPWRMEGTAALNGERGAFSLATGEVSPEGSIRLRTRVLPDSYPVSLETEGDATIDAGSPRYSGGFTLQAFDPQAAEGAAGADVLLRGMGQFEATNERLRIAEYRVEVGGTNDPYVVTGEATIDAGAEPEFLLLADGQQINVDRLATDQDAPAAAGEPSTDTAPPALSLNERIETVRRLLERLPVPDLPGRASLVLPAVIVGETTLREVNVDARPAGDGWRVDRFSAALPGRTQIEATGDLGLRDSFGFSGTMVLASNQPSGFAAWLSDDVPAEIRGMASAGFEARVDFRRGLQRFEDLELVVGDARLAGRFERLAEGDQRSLSFDLSGERFDFEALSAFVKLLTGESTFGLAEHDIVARLQADRFSAFDVEMRDVSTAFTFRDGLLDIDRASIGTVAGASVSGRGTVSEWTGEPQGALAFDITAADPQTLLTVLNERFPGSPVLKALSDKAALLSDTDLSVGLGLGSARASAEPGTTTGFDLTVEGLAGGSSIDLTMTSQASLGSGLDAPLTVSLTAENPRTDRLLAQVGLPVLPFEVAGPAALRATLDGVPFETAEMALDFTAPGTRLEASGEGAFDRTGLREGRFSVSLLSDDVEPYLLLTGRGLPGFGQGQPIDLMAEVSVAPERVALSRLEGDLGGNELSANLAVSREDVPSISGDVRIDAIDIGWLGEFMTGRPLVSLGGDGIVWSGEEFAATEPLPVSFDVALSTDEARFGHSEPARSVTADLTYDEGELRFSDIGADWIGGRLSGGLTFANSGETGIFRTQLAIDGGLVARALREDAVALTASGLFDAQIALESGGRSIEALVGGMTGSGTISPTDLRLSGIDDDALGEILQSADREGFEITEANVAEIASDAIAGGLFTVNQATLPVTVAAGRARLANLRLENADLALAGDVALQLLQAEVDASLTASFEPGEEALPGANPAIGLLFHGPIAEPRRVIDATEMANFLSLRAYERERRRVERVQAAVLEKQRLRREAAYWREQQRIRRAERLAREAEEEEARRRAEEEAAERDAAAAEARRQAEEQAESAAEAEARRQAEQAAAEREAAAAEERRQAEERAAGEGEGTQEPQEEGPVTPPNFSFDEIERFLQDNEQATEGAPAPSGRDVQEGAPLAPPQTAPPAAPALDFQDLPGVGAPF